MGYSRGIFLCILLLTACGQGHDNKPMMQKEHDTMDKAKDVNNMVQQQAEQQKQEADKQAQ